LILRKGKILVFKNREETVIKAENNHYIGFIVTDKNEYSTDFIMRWIEFGFVSVK
jgi:hypothetical protein